MRARLALALTAALAAASSAQADDRTFARTQASLLTEDYVGQPLWSLLASCAGAKGAAHAYFTRRARAAEADRSAAEGARYLELAVARLVADRGLAREAALDVTLPAVEIGRANGVDALAYPGNHQGLKWRAVNTACEEIAAGA